MESTTAYEKRRYSRYRPEKLECNLGQVVDLSMGGIRVLSRRPREGVKILVLHTPRFGKITLDVQMVWGKQISPSEFAVGLVFEEIPADIKPKIEALNKEVAEGASQDRWAYRRPPWGSLAAAFSGLALVCVSQAANFFDLWAYRWIPQWIDVVEPYLFITQWVSLIVGGLLVLTGLSELRRRSNPSDQTIQSAPASARRPDRRRQAVPVPRNPAAQMQRLQQHQRLLNGILESSIGGVGVLKAVRENGHLSSVIDFEIQLINRAAEDLLGKNQVMLVGKTVSKSLPCLMKHPIFNDLTNCLQTGLPVEKHYRLDNGKWMQLAVVQLNDGLAVTFADTTEQRQAQARLRHVAYHDELTGLPNRKLLIEHIDTALGRTRSHPGHKFAVLFLDFDRFKIVNDTLGHEVGDMLLNSISHRLRDSIRGVDAAAYGGEFQLPARLGGDEFVVLLDGIQSQEDAVAVAERLLETFKQPHQLGSHQVVSTASIGVVLSNEDYDCVDELLRDADTAMYEAKNSGKARYVIFDHKMHESIVAQAQLERDLREAVRNEDFTLVYEPIVSLKTGAVAGFEVLIRWNQRERGVVPPDEFIPLAEELNIIAPIGEWVLRKSCKQLARWRKMGMKDVFLNVNLSRAQLYDGDLIDVLRHQIDTHGLDPAMLSLEITETMVMDDVGVMAEKLRELKALGVRLALDDFGTGHSSLNVLHELPLDVLKIDRTFIASAGDAVRRYGAIIATITELAKNLHMQVIAEGIERQPQVALLQGLLCDYAQGWLFSYPVTEDEAANMVAQNKIFTEAA